MAQTLRVALEELVEAVRRDSDEGGKGISGYTSARLTDAREALAEQPFGYLIEKSGINNGYYFTSPAEFEHVEPRFRHIYLPVYAGVAPEKIE